MAREGRRSTHSPRLTAPAMHIGRGWTGVSEMERDCPCQKADCGLVDSEGISERCDQHTMAAGKTIRQMHLEESCPNRKGVWP